MDSLAAFPPLSRVALLLDLDGTLLDIAATPDLVVVAPGLVDDLRRVRVLCGEALAVVTGRPIAQVDLLLGDAPFAVAGEHGTAIRHAPGDGVRTAALPVPPVHWRDTAHRLVERHPGTLFEPKAHGFVLHYRAAPEAGQALHDGLHALLAEQPAAFALMAAKMAWEIKPAATDKGRAVKALMAEAPFAGRLPVFVGDDVTDEDGMREARRHGGIGLRVPDVFADAGAVRAWITTLARGLD